MWVFVVFFICAKDLVIGQRDEVKTVMEGDVLTLQTGVAPIGRDGEIIWFFRSADLSTRIAQMNHGRAFTHYENSLADRLQLDQESGSLTIWNIRTSDSGVYDASLTTKLHLSEKKFKVKVYAPVSAPVIERNYFVIKHQSSGTVNQSQGVEQICSVSCSVKNERDVFISWYKDGEKVNESSNPDLKISLSLRLELHYEDPESYSCTAANPVSNKSIRLHVKEICSRQEDCQDYCGVTEAVIRLVLSALVGIATVAFLFDHVRFCSTYERHAASSVC